MALRQLLKRPGPGTYGKLKVLPKRHDTESMQFCAFRQLSEWLIMRAAGNTSPYIQSIGFRPFTVFGVSE
jgi:hypothetical protein